MAANAEGLEWRQARQYLIQSGVIPPTHRVTKPDVDLVDFARSLRDGVFLCSLLNKMKPDCVEDWSPRPLMQHSYLRNIAAFLQACKKQFNLQDLFVESDLYEVDNFKKVMQVLSRLSHSPQALSLGWVPFPRKEQRNYYNQVSNEEAGSIYASLQEVNSSRDRLYANVEELYDSNPADEEDPYSYGNESIYDSICYYQALPQAGRTTDADEKKVYVLAELFETEKNVVRVLKLICQNYYTSVRQLVSSEDCRLLFDTAQVLYPVHCNLLEGLERSQEMKHDTSRSVAEVTQHFLSQHTGFLHYGQYAVRLPFAIEKAKMMQTRGETAKAMLTVQQASEASERRFPLSDLLNVPIQRVLKYPLLMKELLKCAQKQTVPSQHEVTTIQTVIDQLEDLARYINSVKGDAEDMKQIEEVEQSFSEPLATPLLQCGRYRLDGELKVKSPGDTGSKKWVFLFDKVMLVCRKPRAVFDQKYVVKQVYQVAQLRVEAISPQSRTTKGQYGLHLFIGGTVEIEMFAKTEEMKTRWMEAIRHAKEVIAPREANRGNHNFELTTFEEACVCAVCSKLLCGCYFQGYYCQVCMKSCHYGCLCSVWACKSLHPPAPNPPPSRPPLTHKPSFPGTDHPPVSPRTAVPRRGNSLHDPDMHGAFGHAAVYVAKQRYDAIGHRQSRVLTFDRGDELEVMNPVPGSDWWEATSLRTGKQGEVPSSYLARKHEDQLHLDQMREEERIKTFSWFIGKMSRIEAEQCLHRMKDGVFLIRESDARQGEYAIALRWKKMPKHIKICKHPDTKRFYVSDVTDFPSVWELVSYYQGNSLGTSFPGVDTTLRYPYKEVETRPRGGSNPPPPPPLPPSRSHQPLPSPLLPHPERELWAEVLFNFSSEYPDEMSIEKHEHVQVLDKQTEKPGWWYGQCSDRIGLFPSNYVREILS